MINKLLHTPEGVRDIYNSECEKKLVVENKINNVFRIFGYHNIETPALEFFDVFAEERGSVKSHNMYKLFDRDGYTMVLRPDITPSIARCVAKYYMDETMPVKLCYKGNTYINHSEHQGKLKEITQMGCENICDDSVDADAEMIAIVVKLLKESGLKEFQVEIGQVDFFKGLVEEANLDIEVIDKLRDCIERKNFFGANSILKNSNISEELKEVFINLPKLFGNIEVLDKAKELTNNKRATAALTRLYQLYDILKEYKIEQYVSFDLGMLSNYNYYTGIIFKGYTYGSGDAIVTGGRYDTLLSQFKKDCPAVGFGVIIDSLMLSLSRQNIEVKTGVKNTLLLYCKESRPFAVSLSGVLRKDNEKVVLLCKDDDKNLEDYKAYAKRTVCGGILYLKNTEDIDIIDLNENSTNTVKISDLLNGQEEQ